MQIIFRYETILVEINYRAGAIKCVN